MYYFDIETDTEGRKKPDLIKDKIVTIQYQPFYDDSGNVKGPLKILKGWESSEKEILESFLNLTGWFDDPPYPWKFILAGSNLSYDLLVITNRSKELLDVEIPLPFLMGEVPKIDLKTALIIANRGKFKGSGLDNFSNKAGSGKLAAKYIAEKDWTKLLEYIEQEADAFLEVYRLLARNLPRILKRNI